MIAQPFLAKVNPNKSLVVALKKKSSAYLKNAFLDK